MREIIFYETDFGEKPVEEFLTELEPSARAKVVRSLEMLRTLSVVPAKFWQKLSDQKLWEIRAEYGGNIYRVLASTAKGNKVILLHGFQKKSQKTPRQDMEIAQQRQRRYFQRHGYL
ncbi:MAG TPA: type II toxin-antitoxin system RelE/ParE family toxin [Chthoniobacterales bacterium]|nr:type II toxin-antitoxin system RelE/ParE family toxin [Chthoniobacterales bacterium]